MTFVNEDELRKQDKLINTYLQNKKILKERLQNDLQSKQQLQQTTSEIFRPITQALEETQKKTDERQDKLIENIQQQLIEENPNKNLAIDEPNNNFTVNFEKDFSDEEKQLLAEKGLETDIKVLVDKGPGYAENLKERTRILNRQLGGQRKGANADRNMIDRKIAVFRKYREKLKKFQAGMEFTVGSGLTKDPNKLIERLHLLAAAKKAGNNNGRLNKEITSILKKLKSSKCVSSCEHKKLCGVLLK